MTILPWKPVVTGVLSVLLVAFWLAVFMTFLGGCPAWMATTHPATETRLEIPQPPDVAWATALATVPRLGGMIWHQDNQTRMLQAFVHTTVELTIRIEPRGTGSTLIIHEQPAATYLGAVTGPPVTPQILAAYE